MRLLAVRSHQNRFGLLGAYHYRPDLSSLAVLLRTARKAQTVVKNMLAGLAALVTLVLGALVVHLLASGVHFILVIGGR